MYKVFIVDDEPQVIYGLRTQVDWESFNMELAGTATNGLDFLDALAVTTIHLLIADVRMPQLDGISLISKAKRLNPSLRCIMISAYSDFDYVKQSFQLGVENYLLKPINEVELRDTLSKTLENLDRQHKEHCVESADLLAFRTNILDRWVNGNIQEFELYERADLLDMDLTASEYAVCVVEIIDSGDFKSEVTCASVLLERCRKSLSLLRAECFVDNSFHVTIILLGASLEQAREDVSSLLEHIGTEVKANGVRIFTSIGQPVSSSTDVSASYLNASLHLNYRFVDPKAAILICRDDLKPSNHAVPQEFHRMLLTFDHLVQKWNGDDEAVQLVQKFIERYSRTPVETMKSIMLPLVLHLIRWMFESGRQSDTLSADQLHRFSEYLQIQSVHTLRHWLSTMIQISLQVISERRGSFSYWVQRVMEEIHQNYHTEVSLKTISNKLNVSSAYLGHLFKEETGKYFNDVLIDIRMQSSRTLLLESNMKVNEVARRVGIPNQSYFNRVFKSKFGLTPVEFRKSSTYDDEVGS